MALFATLIDPFDGTTLDTGLWSASGGAITVGGGHATLATTTELDAVSTYDLTGSQLVVQLSNVNLAAGLEVWIRDISTGAILYLFLSTGTDSYAFWRTVTGGAQDLANFTYDPITCAYFRFREDSGGRGFIESSPDSRSWTTLIASSVAIGLTAGSFAVWGGVHVEGVNGDPPPIVVTPSGFLWAWSAVNPPPPLTVGIRAPHSQQLVIGDWRSGPEHEMAQVTNRKLTLNLLEPSTITFDVTGYADPNTGWFDANLLAEGISDVLWRRNGSGLLLARLTQTSDRIDASGHTISCTCVDYRALLDRRLVLQDTTGPLAGSGKKSFGSIPLTSIVWQLITNTQGEVGGNLGLTQGVWPATTPVYNSYEVPDGDTVWSAIQKLAAPSSVAIVTEHRQANGTNVISANLPGFDIDIDARKRVNMYYPTRSTDRGVKLDYVAGGGGAIASIGRTIDMANYANYIRQSGGGLLGDNPLTSFILLPASDLASRPEGRWDIAASDTNVLTLETLRGAAARSFDLYAKLQPTYTLTLVTDFWDPSLISVGDVVTVAINSGRLQVTDKLRVISIAISIDSSDRETVELTVGRPRPDMFKFLSASVRNLNRR